MSIRRVSVRADSRRLWVCEPGIDCFFFKLHTTRHETQINLTGGDDAVGDVRTGTQLCTHCETLFYCTTDWNSQPGEWHNKTTLGSRLRHLQQGSTFVGDTHVVVAERRTLAQHYRTSAGSTRDAVRVFVCLSHSPPALSPRPFIVCICKTRRLWSKWCTKEQSSARANHTCVHIYMGHNMCLTSQLMTSVGITTLWPPHLSKAIVCLWGLQRHLPRCFSYCSNGDKSWELRFRVFNSEVTNFNICTIIMSFFHSSFIHSFWLYKSAFNIMKYELELLMLLNSLRLLLIFSLCTSNYSFPKSI